jgi:hypothetical protein
MQMHTARENIALHVTPMLLYLRPGDATQRFFLEPPEGCRIINLNQGYSSVSSNTYTQGSL